MRRGSQVAPRSLVASPTRLCEMSCQKICILIKVSLQSITHQSKPACKKRRKRNLELKPHITVCVSAQVVLFFLRRSLKKNNVPGDTVTVLRASECLYQTVFHRSDLDFLRFQSLSAHTESASPLKKLSQRGNKDRAIKRCSQK